MGNFYRERERERDSTGQNVERYGVVGRMGEEEEDRKYGRESGREGDGEGGQVEREG